MKTAWEKLNSRVCPWWLIWSFDNPLRRLIQDPERILSGLVSPGDEAADIGCGMGYFTIPLARLVGPAGRVLAIDLQERMLAGVRHRAQRAGVSERIQLCRATPAGLGAEGPVDFALTFWMAHEVPDQRRFFAQIHALLKPGGRWLLAEPPMHVTAATFARSVATAVTAGFTTVAPPRIRLSRTALLRRS
jgi:2-polyprenyl-3-methyl-5-hydroxy-6-metoxy-1,4-benzoquinol methylase